MKVLHDLFPYNPDHGIYFKPNKISQERPTFEEVISSFEFDMEIIVAKYVEGNHNPEFIIGGITKKETAHIGDIPVELYEKIKDKPVMQMSFCVPNGLWIDLGDENEQMSLFRKKNGIEELK